MTRAEIARDKIAALKKENRRLRVALEKITKAYVRAPGWAAPIPTTNLVWKMYDAAKSALNT